MATETAAPQPAAAVAPQSTLHAWLVRGGARRVVGDFGLLPAAARSALSHGLGKGRPAAARAGAGRLSGQLAIGPGLAAGRACRAARRERPSSPLAQPG